MQIFAHLRHAGAELLFKLALLVQGEKADASFHLLPEGLARIQPEEPINQ